MDKYEYKLKVEEIKNLISKKEYKKAVEIADTIDWRRAKSVMMLCTVSDLYKINRRFEESRDVLLLAYDRHPGGRLIVYSLCELAIKMGDVIHAIEYYKEFVQIAPQDTGRFVLQYRIYEMQDVSLEERIHVLEEFKKREYKEKWAYELAYLYHRVGLGTKCVEECDELILWFGEGKYVLKALELKLLHQPLNDKQQLKYDILVGLSKSGDSGSSLEKRPSEPDIQVKTVNVGQYDTMNLQKELAKSMQDLLMPANLEQTEIKSNELKQEVSAIADRIFNEEAKEENISQPEEAEVKEPGDSEEEAFETLKESELLIDGTGEINSEDIMFHQEILIDEILSDNEKTLEQVMEEKPLIRETLEQIKEEKKQENRNETQSGMIELNPSVVKNLEAVQTSFINSLHENHYDQILSQEKDGQISIVLPEQETIEKQITGQLSIAEVMAEWEKMKKENEQKRMEEVRLRVLEQTGPMFSDFDEAAKSGILEQLNEAAEQVAAAEKIPEIVKLSTDEKVDIQEEDLEELSEFEEESVEEAEIKPYFGMDMETPEEDNSFFNVKDDEFMNTGEIQLNLLQEEELEDPCASEDDFDVDLVEDLPQDVLKREFTTDEKALFEPFIHTEETRDQIADLLDKVSLAAFTGNILITGDRGSGTMDLAKNIVKSLQISDPNFSGKVAKISGDALNVKDFSSTMLKLDNGALIVERAAKMNEETVNRMLSALNQEKRGILVILEDTRKHMKRFMEKNPQIQEFFNGHVHLAAMSSNALVEYAKDYAMQREYSIDEFGILALYTRIEDMQTNCHNVTVEEVRKLVDEAIENSNHFRIRHLFDVIFKKRFDHEDMVILGEKDFSLV